MALENVDQQTGLVEFLKTIYKDAQGYMCVALKNPAQSQHNFSRHYFKWPEQAIEISKFIQVKKVDNEVYFSPALFKTESSKKADVKCSRVAWVEFDGKLPDNLSNVPEPNIRVRSSTENHEHWYWCFDKSIQPYDLERINRSLTYLLGADASGWDASQILRPIHTFNHKRQREVTLLSLIPEEISPQLFEDLPEPPPPVEAPIPTELPPIEDIISRINFPPKVWSLFKKGVPQDSGKRSDALMALGYYLAELQAKDEEIFALLLNADERWGKFKGRADQHIRLMEIVVRARQKYPYEPKVKTEQGYEFLGLKTLLKTKVNLEWIWEGFLQKQGFMLITGPSGVGKTLFSLDAAAHLALGKPFLNRPTGKPLKVAFFSLEMGLADLKFFLSQQVLGYTEEEIDLLEENFKLLPLGEPIYMNREEEKKKIEKNIDELNLDGIFIDSLGSTTEEELSHEKDVKNLLDWQDRIRAGKGVFSWFIHHHRKATGDNKRPNKLSDVFGSQYITARPTSVLCLWDGSVSNSLEVIPLKVRLSAKPKPFSIFRDAKLQFLMKSEGVTQPKPEKESPDEIVEEEKNVFNENISASEETMGI